MSERPQYGADGFPYIVGLSAAALVLLAGGVSSILAAHGAARIAGFVACALGLVCTVPAFLGIRYVKQGKFALRDSMLTYVSWRGDEVVADFGAGAGLLGIGAAKKCAGPVYCIDLFISKDLSGNSAQRLNDNARIELVTDRIIVQQRDVRDCGLPDGSVDVVLSTLCVHNIADRAEREKVLVEMARIVRDGGRVIISDLANVDDEYVPQLRSLGFTIEDVVKVGGSFPPQRLLIASAPNSLSTPTTETI